jgi:hypothetical protein
MLAMAPAVHAAANAPVNIDAIRAEQAEIRKALTSKNGPYEAMPEEARSAVLARQAALLRMLEGRSTTAELSEDEKVEAINAVAWIEAKLIDAKDNRVVCEMRKTLGTNRKERLCMTVRQQREQREAAREQLSRGVCEECKAN